MIEKSAPVATLITNRALCCDCIAQRVGLEPAAVEAVIRRVAQTIRVDLYLNGTCLDCRKSALVYAIDCPPPR